MADRRFPTEHIDDVEVIVEDDTPYGHTVPPRFQSVTVRGRSAPFEFFLFAAVLGIALLFGHPVSEALRTAALWLFWFALIVRSFLIIGGVLIGGVATVLSLLAPGSALAFSGLLSAATALFVLYIALVPVGAALIAFSDGAIQPMAAGGFILAVSWLMRR